ncbi:MAG: WhiB family transcriptional regulator [Aeromicrobium sp.]|uniref:WhiB family transcriptional regulator n=1 Tax=Aeromicrobium sp. TaxID=1871063 RepID=UPI002601CCDB|nr:WhiB family transcriptional regulator [Aeromicrobium sp.]MDF1705057.1 WhiB family transcriptional regulator [Aeromicrobium sp.]
MSPGANARTRVLQAAMRAVCDECPLFDLCEQTAQQLQPTAGFWAGKSYNRHTLTPGDRRGLHG